MLKKILWISLDIGFGLAVVTLFIAAFSSLLAFGATQGPSEIVGFWVMFKLSFMALIVICVLVTLGCAALYVVDCVHHFCMEKLQ